MIPISFCSLAILQWVRISSLDWYKSILDFKRDWVCLKYLLYVYFLTYSKETPVKRFDVSIFNIFFIVVARWFLRESLNKFRGDFHFWSIPNREEDWINLNIKSVNFKCLLIKLSINFYDNFSTILSISLLCPQSKLTLCFFLKDPYPKRSSLLTTGVKNSYFCNFWDPKRFPSKLILLDCLSYLILIFF